jgi:hypothetical protein
MGRRMFRVGKDSAAWTAFYMIQVTNAWATELPMFNAWDHDNHISC